MELLCVEVFLVKHPLLIVALFLCFCFTNFGQFFLLLFLIKTIAFQSVQDEDYLLSEDISVAKGHQFSYRYLHSLMKTLDEGVQFFSSLKIQESRMEL